jgi:aspartate carbamoyltransferase catalytic subunit
VTTDNAAELQRDHAGRLRHLLTLDGLSREEIEELLDLAQFYVRTPGDMPARDQSLAGRTVANLFFEPSTRTRVSFELAARRLGADVVSLDLHSSSRVKGETCSSCATPSRGCRPTSRGTLLRT